MTTLFFPDFPPVGKIYVLIFWRTFKLVLSKGHNKTWPFHPVWGRRGLVTETPTPSLSVRAKESPLELTGHAESRREG